MDPFVQNTVTCLIGSVVGSLIGAVVGGVASYYVARMMYRNEVKDGRLQREIDDLTALEVKADVAHENPSYRDKNFPEIWVLIGRLRAGQFKESLRDAARNDDWLGVAHVAFIYRGALLRDLGFPDDNQTASLPARKARVTT